MESMNGKLRDECLNMHVLVSLRESGELLSHWRNYYNQERPHSILGYLTPSEWIASKLAREEKKHCEQLKKH